MSDTPAPQPAQAALPPDPDAVASTALTPDAPEPAPEAGTSLPPSYPPARRPTPLPATPGGAAQQGQERRRPWSTLVTLVAVVVVAALIKTFVVQWFEIPSGSMEDTLEVGDRVAVTLYDSHEIERGDIVVFRDPDHWLDVEDPTGLRGAVRDVLILIHLLPQDSGHHLIKRVIGMPGDHVVATGDGPVSVNGVELDEPYVKAGRVGSDVAFDVTVPEGFVWVMGDNRSNSADSRYHRSDVHRGFVPLADVVGVAKAVVWPVGSWGGLSEGTHAFASVPGPSGKAPDPHEPAPEDGA